MVVPLEGLDDVTKKDHLLVRIPRGHKAVRPKELIIAALSIRQEHLIICLHCFVRRQHNLPAVFI